MGLAKRFESLTIILFEKKIVRINIIFASFLKNNLNILFAETKLGTLTLLSLRGDNYSINNCQNFFVPIPKKQKLV